MPICTRCRQSEACEGDLWCLPCTGWEALGRDLASHWDHPGSRIIAGDLIVSCVRQVRSLRNLGAGIHRASSADGSRATSAGHRRALTEGSGAHHLSLRETGLKRDLPAPPPPPAKLVKEESEDEEGEESEETEELLREVHPLTGKKGPGRGPEPDPSLPRSSHKVAPAFESRRKETSERDRHRDRRQRSERDRTRSGKRRGGRKHQRLHRLGTNPNLVIHRKKGDSFWELQSLASGATALERFSWTEWLNLVRFLPFKRERNGFPMFQRRAKSWMFG